MPQPGFREVTEMSFALPFTFGWDDYVQILTDIAEKLGPALGWQPRQLPGLRPAARSAPPPGRGRDRAAGRWRRSARARR